MVVSPNICGCLGGTLLRIVNYAAGRMHSCKHKLHINWFEKLFHFWQWTDLISNFIIIPSEKFPTKIPEKLKTKLVIIKS